MTKKLRRQQRITSQKKNLGGAFVPASGEKKPSGVGSFYGTMTGPGKLEAFRNGDFWLPFLCSFIFSSVFKETELFWK